MTDGQSEMEWPHVVTEKEWQAELAELAEAETAVNDALRDLAARRRRMPVTEVGPYEFDGPQGRVGMPELFAGRRQLITYHFYAPAGSSTDPCMGCSAFVDNFGRQEHLNARDTTLVLVSGAPREHLRGIQERMGWTLPWYSSAGSDFESDHGVADWAGMSLFVRHPDTGAVHRTYFTNGADLERLRTDFQLLDLTLLGRQETGEDSPPGWPQTPPFEWWHLHDEYPDEPTTRSAR